MLYERLNPEMQQMVDDYAQRLQVYDWGRRSELLSEVSIPFGEELGPRQAKIAAAGFLTGVLERWGLEEIEDPRQARLYLMSLNPEHRELAGRYFEEHPEAGGVLEA